MNQLRNSPYSVVGVSAVTYATVCGLLLNQSKSYADVQKLVKGISSGHSILTTLLVVAALNREWVVTPSSSVATRSTVSETISIGPGNLDDSENSLISGRSSFANLITAWETGYLIYDTAALVFLSYRKDRTQSFPEFLKRCFHDSPVFMLHHLAIVSALLYLQHYIAVGREKGLKIIMAFLLMNASNPLLHLRWWQKKTTGRRDLRIELALAFVFALTRFGGVYYVMQQYGEYHQLDAWKAFRKQRLPCQLGTGLLTSMNGIWWVGLLTQMIKRER